MWNVFLVLYTFYVLFFRFLMLSGGGGSPGRLAPPDSIGLFLFAMLVYQLLGDVFHFFTLPQVSPWVRLLAVLVCHLVLVVHRRSMGVYAGVWKRQDEEKFRLIATVYDWYRSYMNRRLRLTHGRRLED
jgi:hypothetical protein